MTNKVRMVIMTMSDKHNGYCVAGMDLESSKWVRLINEENSHFQLCDRDLKYEDNTQCSILDVVEVTCVQGRTQLIHQPENICISNEEPLKKISSMSWKDALRGCDVVREEYILGVPPRPPFVHCEERRLMSRPKQKSLALVCAKKTYIIPPDEGKFHSKIIFDYHNSQGCVLRYKLTLTDPDFQVDSNLFLGDILLIVSLGEEYESKYFLLAAKVIQKV